MHHALLKSSLAYLVFLMHYYSFNCCFYLRKTLGMNWWTVADDSKQPFHEKHKRDQQFNIPAAFQSSSRSHSLPDRRKTQHEPSSRELLSRFFQASEVHLRRSQYQKPTANSVMLFTLRSRCLELRRQTASQSLACEIHPWQCLHSSTATVTYSRVFWITEMSICALVILSIYGKKQHKLV